MERRLAAILAADVVGYSRLMGVDEAGTLGALKTHRRELIDPKIAAHRGRIVKLMGDGALVEFPSAVEALECAAEIQHGMAERNSAISKDRRIEFRIGINIGDIIVEDEDIYGNGVNVAARLESLADPGGIYISGRVFDQVEKNVNLGFTHLGPKKVKNIERPVNVYKVDLDPSRAGTLTDIRRWQEWRLRWVVAVVAGALVAGGAGVWGLLAYLSSPESLIVPDRGATLFITGEPTVAVMPLLNLSDDPAQEFIAVGITEDLINALGHFSSLTILSYNAVFPFKEERLPTSELAQRIQARYLVEGTLRRSGDRIRVAVRLTDAAAGTLLWSEQFDEQFRDVLLLQETIASTLAGKLASNVRMIEERRSAAKPIENMDAYNLVLQARALTRKGVRSANYDARRLLERAIELNPRRAIAHALLGRAHYDMAVHGWTEFPDQAIARAETHARTAVALNASDVSGHRLLARVYVLQTQYQRGLAQADRAIALNPSDAESNGIRGYALLWSGRIQEAIEAQERQFFLDSKPHPTSYLGLGICYYLAHRFIDAVAFLEQARIVHPDYGFFLPVLAASYYRLGRQAEAAESAALLKKRNPFFDPTMFGSRLQDPSHRTFLRDGLFGAGIKPPNAERQSRSPN